MGGYEGARLVHFFAMAALVLFVLVHVVMVALVPRTFPRCSAAASRREELIMKRNRAWRSSLDDCSRARSRASSGACSCRRGLSARRAGAADRLRRHRPEGVQKVLWAISRWNDRVQAGCSIPNQLAPDYPESAITRPFPFNAFYARGRGTRASTRRATGSKLAGLVARQGAVDAGRALRAAAGSQVTRHICVEGWSAIGKWGGVRFTTS